MRTAIKYDKGMLKRSFEIVQASIKPDNVQSLLKSVAEEFKSLTKLEVSIGWIRSKAKSDGVVIKKYLVKQGDKSVPAERKTRKGRKAKEEMTPEEECKTTKKPMLAKDIIVINSRILLPSSCIKNSATLNKLNENFSKDNSGKRFVAFNYPKGNYEITISKDDVDKDVWRGITMLYQSSTKQNKDIKEVRIWTGF
jgi:hypothetical protein